MTFTMWSLGHYLFLITPFVGIILLYQLTKSYDQKKNRRIGLILSIVAVMILILRNIEIFVYSGYAFDVEILPLQVCHFANIVLLLAFLSKKQSLFNFALLLNLPAAFVSILFANSLANYSTILTFRGFAYIFGHILLVVIPVWAYMVGFIKLNKKTLIETIKIVSILYLVSIMINNVTYLLFGQYANYFYTLKPENGTPLEMFYDLGQTVVLSNGFKFNILYLILTGLFGLVIMIVLYTGFYLHQKRR